MNSKLPDGLLLKRWCASVLIGVCSLATVGADMFKVFVLAVPSNREGKAQEAVQESVTWQGSGTSTIQFTNGVFVAANARVTFAEAATLTSGSKASNGIGIGSIEITGVPEPRTIALLFAALGMFIVFRHRH